MNCSWEDRFAIGRDCMLKNGLCSSSSCSSICSMVSLPFAQLSSPWQYSEFSSNPAHFFFLLISKASYINEIKWYIHFVILKFFQNSKIKHQAITYYWLKGNILRRMVISTIFKRPNFRIFYSVTRRGTVWLGMILTWNIADTITTFPQVGGLRV